MAEERHLEQEQEEPASQVQLRLQILDGSGVERRMDVQLESTATLAQLKDPMYLGVDASGWRVHFVFRGRRLGDAEPLSRLPSGACLQCYMHQPPPVESDDAEPDSLMVAWARLAGIGNPFPPEKWQDVAFHSSFILGLAAAWFLYLSEPESFDFFGRCFLRFFSFAWVLAFCGDFLVTPGLPQVRP
ncbi:unnamed protein product [Effrenium voratum]|uniref:Ubiquitin-like domain-containing protein n=1 Tax=Effrenium voratum TaxID=2562239 RepID=A0AA36MX55_9DINO|nr:unnamed protein product [Effrenium voratum]CAJ1386868.1 unnamed protein product [Effrenium voratum]CAJ1428513.1 unnamed protein product [Effrenium voratum]